MCGFRATEELAGLHSNPRLEISQTTVYSESKSFGKVIRGKGVCEWCETVKDVNKGAIE